MPARALDPAELARYCASRLPRFAIPRYIDVVADLPRTENGKVQKFRLRERGVTASDVGPRRRGGACQARRLRLDCFSSKLFRSS